MKKNISSVISLFLLPLILTACSENPKQQITEQVKTGIKQDAKEFMESLKAVLVKELQSNGIVAAVSVCSDTAQVLTNEYGVKKGIYIKRVSFKNRYPNNKPDQFETEALKEFEILKLKGELTENTEYYSIVENNGVTTVRYLKPIFIQAPCLSCHGNSENIGPDVKEILRIRYPEDKATGYELDELRGAVSIQKTL